MAEMMKIKGADGFAFDAWHAEPQGARKGGVIVVQEIFGIDQYVKADVERWAQAGYEAIAPSLYDRREPSFTADHSPDGLKAGIAHAMGTPREQALGDIAACRDALDGKGKVCIVGYCYGGSMAWLSAASLDGLAAASSYYGSMVQANAALPLKCPVIVHLGRTDTGIPADDVKAAVEASHPDVPVYIYETAGHGFNNESPERYDPEAAKLARERTRTLFDAA